jgi:UDP-N-acetylmuramate--alanine ligase
MNIYFIGIGGSGLSPLAQLAIDCGYSVWGSDIQSGLGTQAVESRGIEVNYHTNPNYLAELHAVSPIDYIVYTSACKPTDKELAFAKDNNISFGKRDNFINKILKEKNLKMLAIAGTHGKTTTTAMVVWLFQKLGIPVSYLIGSNISFGPAASYEKSSEYFVYEADEFDKNFLHYNPFHSVITNIDYDHPDTYPTQKEYFKAFSVFVSNCRSLLTWEIEEKILGETKQVGFISEKDIDPKIKLPGLHNRKNATLAILLIKSIFKQKVNSLDLIDIINLFPGTQRRFERISTNVYSDYAHHPTEIKATLQLASEFSQKVAVVYQPHQNIRQHEIKDQYKTSFSKAKKVYWLPTYLSREDPDLEVLTGRQLTAEITPQNKIIISELDQALLKSLQEDLANGYTVVAMGAGSIDTWIRNNLQDTTELKQNYEKENIYYKPQITQN